MHFIFPVRFYPLFEREHFFLLAKAKIWKKQCNFWFYSRVLTKITNQLPKLQTIFVLFCFSPPSTLIRVACCLLEFYKPWWQPFTLKTDMESEGSLSYLLSFLFFSQPQPHSILACLFLENRQFHASGYTYSPLNGVKTAQRHMQEKGIYPSRGNSRHCLCVWSKTSGVGFLFGHWSGLCIHPSISICIFLTLMLLLEPSKRFLF